jgi:hypothetical protein
MLVDWTPCNAAAALRADRCCSASDTVPPYPIAPEARTNRKPATARAAIWRRIVNVMKHPPKVQG